LERGRIEEPFLKEIVVLCCLALAGCASDPTPPQVPSGDWGGRNAELVVTASGATSHFKCGANGEIASPLSLDTTGRFTAQGTYDPRLVQGGPRPATYTGRLNGSEMELTVEVEDSALGPFTLHRGEAASFDVCNFS
jgi:hypothetical protein